MAGEIRSEQGLNGLGNPAFILNITKGKLFLFTEPCLYVDTNAIVCLDCGLLWSHPKLEETRCSTKSTGTNEDLQLLRRRE